MFLLTGSLPAPRANDAARFLPRPTTVKGDLMTLAAHFQKDAWFLPIHSAVFMKVLDFSATERDVFSMLELPMPIRPPAALMTEMQMMVEKKVDKQDNMKRWKRDRITK